MSNVQRQGRISWVSHPSSERRAEEACRFYMTCFGEEAAVVCSAAAWQDTDEIFGQYRGPSCSPRQSENAADVPAEQGVLLWRGFTSVFALPRRCHQLTP